MPIVIFSLLIGLLILKLKNILHIIALLSLILLYNVNYIYNCAVHTAIFHKVWIIIYFFQMLILYVLISNNELQSKYYLSFEKYINLENYHIILKS